MEYLTPAECVQFLHDHPKALFIDCRSEVEYLYVGHPLGALHVSWNDGSDWDRNPHFVGMIKRLAGHSNERPVVLICRSGHRSVDAATALEEKGFPHVYVVQHGFEGDLDDNRHRGNINGWRHDGLPWEQC